ncbi:hypothetical protein PSHT_08322, partial [Puccinia striiformis]
QVLTGHDTSSRLNADKQKKSSVHHPKLSSSNLIAWIQTDPYLPSSVFSVGSPWNGGLPGFHGTELDIPAHHTSSNHASSGYGSQPEIFSQHAVPTPIMADHLNDNTPPANPGSLFVPNTPPYTPSYDLAANLTGFLQSTNGDDVYWLDPFPQVEHSGLGSLNKLPEPVPSSNPSNVDQLAGSTYSLSSGLGPLPPPNSRDAFVLNAPMDKIPSLVGVLSMINDVSVTSKGPPLSSFPDDPRDLTYSPPKAATARSKRRACSSNHCQTKPKFANTQARDARGRFKSASSIRLALPYPLDISTVMSELEASRRVLELLRAELAPLSLIILTHFDPSLAPAPSASAPPSNTCMESWAPFQHLYGVLGPLLAELSYPRENLPRVLEISQTLYKAQEWYLESVHFYPDVTGLDQFSGKLQDRSRLKK